MQNHMLNLEISGATKKKKETLFNKSGPNFLRGSFSSRENTPIQLRRERQSEHLIFHQGHPFISKLFSSELLKGTLMQI